MSILIEGDTVKLISGGPLMTVSQVLTGGQYGASSNRFKCRWFDFHGVLHEGHFSFCELVKESLGNGRNKA